MLLLRTGVFKLKLKQPIINRIHLDISTLFVLFEQNMKHRHYLDQLMSRFVSYKIVEKSDQCFRKSTMIPQRPACPQVTVIE